LSNQPFYLEDMRGNLLAPVPGLYQPRSSSSQRIRFEDMRGTFLELVLGLYHKNVSQCLEGEKRLLTLAY
jgi:hypothetical protein